MSSTFSIFSGIGGYNIYLKVAIIEECDKKDSVWEALKKEVLCLVQYNYIYIADVVINFTNIEANCNTTVLNM